MFTVEDLVKILSPRHFPPDQTARDYLRSSGPHSLVIGLEGIVREKESDYIFHCEHHLKSLFPANKYVFPGACIIEEICSTTGYRDIEIELTASIPVIL